MKTKGKYLNDTRLKQAPTAKLVELYSTPQVEVIEIELTQNILQSSPGKGNAPSNFDGYDW